MTITIEESRAILLAYGIKVYCSFPSHYTVTRALPWYGDSEKRKPIKEGFSVSHCSLGDVRAMAQAYKALALPATRESFTHCRQILGDAWRAYTAARVHAESVGTLTDDWADKDNSPVTLARLAARGSERAHWHTHRVWQENVRARGSALSAIASGVA